MLDVEKIRTSADIHDVTVKVVSQKGVCFARHKVGDEFLFGRDHLSPAGVCVGALAMLLTHVRALQRGAEYPEFPEDGVINLVCPDPDNPVVFELRRTR